MAIESEVTVTESVREISIEGPPDEVWEAMTDPDAMADWLGGDLDLDGPLEPGAAGTFVDTDGAQHDLLVVIVEPGERLAWHWWSEGGELSTVEITLNPDEDGDHTLVRVVEVLMVEQAPFLEMGAPTVLPSPTFDTGPSSGWLSMRSGTLVGV